MIFSSEKKELWRYASRNNANCASGSGNNSRPQQLHRHQQLHRLQSPPPDYYLTTNDRLNNSLQQHQQQQQKQHQRQVEEEENQQTNYNTPPPPYSIVPCGNDYSINACRRMSTSNNSGNGGEKESNYSVDRSNIINNNNSNIIDGKSSTCRSLSNGSIASYGNQRNKNSHDYYYNYSNHNNNNHSISSENFMNGFFTCDQLSKTIMPSLQQNHHQQQQQPQRQEQQGPTIATPIIATATTATTLTSTAASVLAATAANIFRNCCGGGSVITNDTRGAEEEDGDVVESTISSLSTIMCRQHNVLTPRQYFDALLKQLKEGQVTAMLKAVKSRIELVTTLQQQQTNCCILVHRAPILNEEPYVIACRLFFWYDLKNANELKRLPSCPNACDPIYVCCNPLHWCRIFKTETAPPPYQQRSTTSSSLQLEDTISEKNYLNGRNQDITSNLPTRQFNVLSKQPQQQHQQYPQQQQQFNIMENAGLCVQFPGSLSTEGEDGKSCSLIWCQLAYWELAQRVGPRYMAKKSSINVYADNPHNDSLNEGMCLKDLSECKKTKTVPGDVQYTRKKIGLGVTLSQESDGVWLYNRSRVPIFLHSPTLSESWFRVCRILPGECVKAFDTHRANSLMYPMSYAGAQMGPVDTFSMRLSFAKGWGCTYKRQDITCCPCWLEVFFTQR